ncbi:general transcription factor IIH subunit TFB6 family [Aspergillus fischeri NRRL 181]|uniref:Meiotic recombination protein DMC1 n=1 Tax=Neosartorya fischeri (strain ATCC 1020 / DSM 3700 / CBS 544.65 / FGSC A1164 / JCM 1740 / NRRL 181 / WB 181) TaxID=331117 RepID=A1D9A0_NEOFI|nr:conserved hypothetical protein [Aspergillus fischeri NRRL 181]EAW20961.1 conserved hypothetical protein [Aspergillus fischeri NRRL 181]KAG2006637.1 hypothetical protein GB937_008515 [Aspergillus fischeri]
MTTTAADGPGPGGFMQSSIPSPAPSSMSSSTATPVLPKPRSHPLKAGSMKETTVINHIDTQVLKINRRHAKKFSSTYDDQSHQDPERGYESFQEVAKDIEGLIDVLWVSGTPSLQIPYMISLAVLVNSYLPDFPFSPKPTFRLLRKLDSVFASLLLGEDVESGAPLSGFENNPNLISMTEKVRIKSIAETCRVAVVEAKENDKSKAGEDDDHENPSDDEDEDEDGVYGTEEYESIGRWEMETAKVYERTIELLGDELGKAGEFCDSNFAAGESKEA